MDDFHGSIAEEDVQFITELLQEAVVGDNFYKLMVFIEATKYVETPAAFTEVVTGISIAEVSSTSYATVTKGLLKSWLADFFANQSTAHVILVTVSPALTIAAEWDPALLETAYGLLANRAYFKTILVTAPVTLVETYVPAAAVDLATLCDADPGLSAPILLPFTTATPATLSSDPVYAALLAANKDAFMACHYDVARNGALYQLGLTFAVYNNSGTPVGNSMDFIASSGIDASGTPIGVTDPGSPLPVATQAILKAANVSYFKYVGDTLGTPALIGASSIKGQVMPAIWIVAYCNYVNRVKVAEYITRRNVLRNNNTYQGILAIMGNTVGIFGDKTGTGRLTAYSENAPSFDKLPESKDTITVANAWSATYVDNVREVVVYGQLTIPA